MPSACADRAERGELGRELVGRDHGVGVRRALPLEVGGRGRRPAPGRAAAASRGLLRFVARAVERLGRLGRGDLRRPPAAAGPRPAGRGPTRRRRPRPRPRTAASSTSCWETGSSGPSGSVAQAAGTARLAAQRQRHPREQGSAHARPRPLIRLSTGSFPESVSLRTVESHIPHVSLAAHKTPTVGRSGPPSTRNGQISRIHRRVALTNYTDVIRRSRRQSRSRPGPPRWSSSGASAARRVRTSGRWRCRRGRSRPGR